MRYRVCFLVLLAFSQLGCGLSRSLLTDVVRNTFSSEYSCPEDRMTVRRVPVIAEELLVAPTPPPEVAADPGRLAVWNATVRSDMADYADLTAFRIIGCDVDRTYLCWDHYDPNGEETDYFCNEIDPYAPRQKLGEFAVSSRVLQTILAQLSDAQLPY